MKGFLSLMVLWMPRVRLIHLVCWRLVCRHRLVGRMFLWCRLFLGRFFRLRLFRLRKLDLRVVGLFWENLGGCKGLEVPG